MGLVVWVPYRDGPPKYVRLVETIKGRIGSGTYPLGGKIPSEAELIAEFGVSRQVVIRALLILEQDGWLRGEHGRGRFVLGVPDSGAVRGLDLMAEVTEVTSVKVLRVGPVKAPNRAAFALAITPGTPVLARQVLTISPELGPIQLATTYVPMDLVPGTDLGLDAPMTEDVIAHLRSRKRVAFDKATDRTSARLATADEAALLEIGPREALLTMLISVYDRDGVPRVAVDVVMPGTRHEMEDTYPV